MAFVERASGAPRRSGARRFLWLVLSAAALCGWMQLRAVAAADEEQPNQKAAAPAPAEKPADNPGAKSDDAAKSGNAAQPQGHFLRIELPINGDIDTKIRASVTRLLGTIPAGGPRPILVFELWPGQSDGGSGSMFSRALDLAKFLSSEEMSRVKTVAYIPKTIKGHAVLVAMACEEIIMAPNAEIGDAGINETVIGPTIRSGYKEISEAQSTIPAAIALGMLDKDLKVFKVVTERGTEYLLEGEIPELEKTHVIQSKEELRPKPLLVDGQRARQELGFVSYLVDANEKRAGVARALQLPASALQDNPALAGGWRPVQVNIKKPITPRDISIIQRKIDDQIRDRDVNFVLLWIDSDGGSFDSSLQLAGKLAGLDSSRIRTVAFIPDHARGDAALIALACDQIVMRPDAVIGGDGADALKDRVGLAVKSLRAAIKDDKARSWSLSAAMIDPELKVYRYTQKGTGLTSYFCEEEAAEQPDPQSWVRGDLITASKGALQLSGRKAVEYGIAWKNVNNFGEFKQAYGLERDPGLVEPGWADHLIAALASDGARMLLLIVGVMGIYLEINTPGVGIGSFVALLAFLLYFWAQHLQGTAEVLEVMLFLAGVVCVALEIFVIPGFGIFGLGGGLLIIASLILASQTFIIPGNAYQLEQMRDTFLVLGGAAVGSVAIGAVVRRYLPHAPVFNRMMLAPPSAAELEALSHRESLVNFNHLLGSRGVATTPLILSGKARFGDELADVISAGEPIDKGAQVVVVDVSGSRIVVESVREA
jgi:membrane-bound serine protease (ClpP class)